MNNVTLVGRLTKKPEMRMIASTGTPVASFQLAVDRDYTSKDGKKEPDYINIEVRGKRAESCEKYLDKGSLISLSGSIRVDRYQNKDGENRTFTKVVANNVRFLFTGKKGNNNGEVASGVEAFETTNGGFENFNTDEGFQVIEDDDIPF